MTGTGDGVIYVEALLARAAAAGEDVLITDGDVPVSGNALCATVYRYARALDDLGLGPGDLVALFAPVSTDGLAVRWAANLIGVATCYLSAPPTAPRRADLIARIEPALLVAFPQTAHLVPDGVTVPTASVGGGVPGPRLDLLAADAPDTPVACRARPDDLGVVASSGGTTGTPKGCTRSFARYTAMITPPGEDRSRRQLVNGGLAYLSQTVSDATLLAGGTLVLRPRFDASDTLDTIEQERITDLHVLEPQLAELVDAPALAERDLSSLRCLVHGGAAAPPTLRRRAWERIGPVLGHGYGASEVGFVLRMPPSQHDGPDRFHTAGLLGPEIPIRLRRKDGELARTGEPGVIEARTPSMAQTYRTLPGHPDVAGPDGWYSTGDLGLVDDDGYLVMLGRAADMVWHDDRPTGPDAVAETACRVPGVGFAVVVPDEPAWIVAARPPHPGDELDVAAVQRAVTGRHGADVGPLVVVALDRIPTTEQGKPDRGAIRELARTAAAR